jgi:energy-coupling factor transporter ATP-binding protein EcfA2
MLSSVHILGYRGIRDFRLEGLGRINLLVGVNNSGKTSVLEAIHAVASPEDSLPLFRAMERRGERVFLPNDESVSRGEFAVAHLFHGHRLEGGAEFRIKGNEGRLFVEGRLVPFTGGPGQLDLSGGFDPDSTGNRLAFEVMTNVMPTGIHVPLSDAGGLAVDPLRLRRLRGPGVEVPRTLFLPIESFAASELVEIWGRLALTPMEDLVLRALRFLDPAIERIAAIPTRFRNRGGFILRRQGDDQPVPIGSMGDGIWRMLSLAIALAHCRGGTLLVDEIDTGLHYTVMSKMWRLVHDAAREFGVQVFATTHSFDCIYSLAQVCENEEDRQAVTIHRIDAAKAQSVRYDEDEIAAAAEHQIEVR